jgi:hypothetical protein
MSELKTLPTDASVEDFLNAVPHAGRRADGIELDALLRDRTGCPPVMWGASIVGYDRYTYVNTTNKPADWPIIGFSPRKANLTLYIMPGFAERPDLMDGLGKYKTSVSCLYLNRLADVGRDRLTALIDWSIATMRERYGVS